MYSTVDLTGRVILVTGASRGIGYAVALAAARAGADIIITGRTLGALEELDDAITADGGHATIVEHDLRDTPALPRLAAAIHERWGRLDGLVANAGMLGVLTPLSHLEPEVWDDTIAVNLTAQWHLIKAMEPLLVAAPAARAVLVSSGAAFGSYPFWGAYAVSKFATEGYMQVLADELKATSQIRVNSLNPGAVNTKMRRTAYPGEQPDTNPSPEALTAHWIYLLSDSSQSLQGETLSAQN